MAGAADRTDQIIEAICRWPALGWLAAFALDRHGYGDSDGGFGVIYADDLDEYDRCVESADIPPLHVEIYGYWGAAKGGYEFVVTEAQYLDVLAAALRDRNFVTEAAAIKALAARLSDP